MRAWFRASVAAIAALGVPACSGDKSPEDYRISEAAGKVTVCLETHSGRACPDQGLLREDVDGGDVVRITACEGGCFVDECAPAGRFRYGLAEPYSCDDAIRDAYYYGEAQFEAPPESCARTTPEPAPDSGVPWGEHRMACLGPGGPDVAPFSACSTGLGGGTSLALLFAGLALRRLSRRRA